MISLVINISQCEFIKTIANKKGHNTRASQKEVIRLRGKKYAPDGENWTN